MPSHKTDRNRFRGLHALWLVLSVGLAGCLSAHDDGPVSDSETHFLSSCDSSCPGDLECICGVCSVTCAPAIDCSDLHASASCVAATDFGSCSVTGSPAVCDVTCSEDADCASLSADHECQAGHCRADTAPVVTCEYDGETYAVGDTFPSPVSDCNVCSCYGDGNVLCGMIGCLGTCTYDGQEYRQGETWMLEGDECGTCSCGANGEVVCESCQPGTCLYDGTEYEVGDVFMDTEGCNACTCQADGSVACDGQDCSDPCALPFEVGPCDAAFPVYFHNAETGACEPGVWGGCGGNDNRFETLAECASACGHNQSSGRDCRVGGVDYPHGAQVPDPFSCNTCTCDDGNVGGCTEIACSTACPPTAIEASGCAQCGDAGGCSIIETACMTVCSEDGQCNADRPFCDVAAGHCVAAYLCD